MKTDALNLFLDASGGIGRGQYWLGVAGLIVGLLGVIALMASLTAAAAVIWVGVIPARSGWAS